MYNRLGSSLIVVALMTGVGVAQQKNASPPSGFQQITSMHQTYEYLLPSGWMKAGLNSYRGPDGSAIEQSLPAAVITAEYCRSGTTGLTEALTTVHDNGQVSGCYIIRKTLNTVTQKELRRVSFRFPSERGIEDLTITVPLESDNQALVNTIVDSIRMK